MTAPGVLTRHKHMWSHAQRRAYQRYKLLLTATDLDELANRVRENRITIVGRRRRAIVCETDWRGTVLKIVALPNNGLVLTVLRREWDAQTE